MIYFGECLDLPPHTEVVDKASRLVGVEPAPLETALREGVAWYLDQPRRKVDYAFEVRLSAQASARRKAGCR